MLRSLEKKKKTQLFFGQLNICRTTSAQVFQIPLAKHC